MPRGHRARFVAQLIVVVLAAALAALLVESVLPVRARRRALTSASSESYESANATTFTRTWVDGGRAGPYEGTCTARCAPTGGALSIVGAWSGQCDCELMVADDPAAVAPTCDVGERAAAAETCCGRASQGSAASWRISSPLSRLEMQTG